LQLPKGENPNPNRIYSWGDEFDTDKANTSETGINETSAVGCFPGGASPYGILDLSGNVWEWTRSLFSFSPNQRNSEERKKRKEFSSKEHRVIRGGSIALGQWRVRCAYRRSGFQLNTLQNLGFRLVLSPLSETRYSKDKKSG
jgi:formylglycine-generating enzyme required for sulfatase activity